MAHQQQKDFCLKVKNKFPEYFKNKKVLDIGSLDINGNNRDLFENCNYLGIDVGEGSNVDLVSIGHMFDGPDNYFDTIISTEVFEHDMFYEETINNIIRMLKPGGLFLFTCASMGRPEHGTKNTDEFSAPLLELVSQEWSNYYKNLEKKDIEKISNFKYAFPDGYFEKGNFDGVNYMDLYFYGIKGGEKYLVNTQPKNQNHKFKDHIFVIDSWPDNDSKEKDLLELIRRLKTFNIQILLIGHYPIKSEIQKLVDYYIFDKDNPILSYHEFEQYQVGSGRWMENNDYRIENMHEFHHDFAIWQTMRHAFNFCKYLNKKYIHFLEYDNIIDVDQYRQSFLERIENYEVIIYEYNLESTMDVNDAYCATFIFSIHTDIALKLVDKIQNKSEYFSYKPNGWALEKTFLKVLREVTNNIHISKYIANENELNTQAVWNRDGMNRGDVYLQVYLSCDENKNLYLNLVSGFHNKIADNDYYIEVNYLDTKKFIYLPKENSIIDCIGKYKKGTRVKLYNNGINIFDEYLGYDFEEFYKLQKFIWKNKSIENPEIDINFIDGAYIHIKGNPKLSYDVQFINNKTNVVEYTTKLFGNWWSKTNKKYFVDWILSIKGDNFNYVHKLNFENKKVLISFDSKSLGDNLAWIPYVEKFRLINKCKIICSTFFNNLFSEVYSEIQFVSPGSTVYDIHAQYNIGLFKNGKEINYEKHPINPLPEPLTKVASDILGLEYEELKPTLKKYNNKKKRQVAIATHSTAQCKYWNNPNGWQEVVNYLKSLRYEVILLSREEDGYMGNRNPQGVKQHPPGDIEKVIKVIQESEMFIGLSSGLSWIAWACDIPTILISGFTDDDLEPKNGIYRVINKNVCNGCWSRFDFDAGDWNWCPEHKGTSRQFECSKSITSDMVIEKINKIIS